MDIEGLGPLDDFPWLGLLLLSSFNALCNCWLGNMVCDL